MSLVLVACASRSSLAFAEPSSSAVIDEADRLDKKAVALSDSGSFAEAAAAEEQSIRMQETQVLSTLPEAVRPLFRTELTDQKLRLSVFLVKAGNVRRGREVLEQEIAFHEKLGAASKRRDELGEWRDAVARLRGAEKDAPAAPSAAGGQASATPLSRIQAAMALHRDGRTSEAMVLLESALPAADTMKETSSGELAKANVVAAEIYEGSMRLTKAEARYLRALALEEERAGMVSPALIDTLTALGNLYLSRGEEERAAPAFMRAHDIARARAEDRVPNAIFGLSRVLEARRDYAEAITLVKKARSLLDASPGNELMSLFAGIRLGKLHDEMGNFSEAEREYDKGRSRLDSMEAAPSKLKAMLSMGLASAYGWHHRKRGNYVKAEAYFREVQDSVKAMFGEKSFTFRNSECDLGEVYWASGDLARSLDPISRCFDAREENIVRVLASGSEEQKRSYLSSFLLPYQKTLTAQVRAGNSNPKLTYLALSQVLRTKGRVLDAMSGENEAVRRGVTTETRDLLSRLATVRASIAQLSASGQNVERAKSMENESRTIEQALSEKSEAFRLATKAVSVESVRAALPKDHALVEIVAFEPMNPDYKTLSDAKGVHYVAFVLDGVSGRAPTSVDLGDASVIDEQVRSFRAALGSPDRDPAAPAGRLYDAVWKPVEALLGGKTKIMLSPDGALNGIPFAALRGGGDYLVAKYTFTYLTSGRDLLRLEGASTDSSAVVVVANPSFAMNGTKPESSSSRFAKVRFSPLEGTEEEAKSIKASLEDAQVLKGDQATERAVKNIAHPRVLHLATHGFFLGDTAMRLADTRGLVLDESEVRKSVASAESPLLRSGLAFAGASSQKGGDGEDGILTALEASSLDLSGTELVVMSACQTAEGEIRNGEGVYGLRRALTMAGARSLVMSLWSVDDDATSYLMKGYYTQLKSGVGRSESLRHVQMGLSQSKTLAHPFYWAAFIPSGDPSSMSFTAASSSQPASAPTARDTAATGDESWLGNVGRPTYTIPPMSFSAGISSLALDPTSSAPVGTVPVSGQTVYVAVESSVIGLIVPSITTEVRDGFALHDRASLMLAGITVDGSDVGASQFDYSLLFGYRTRFASVFAGAMAGNGTIRLEEPFEATGTFVPAAARIELPWFWGSRLSANAWGLKIAGARRVEGIDIRVPLGGPHFWAGVAFERLEGRVGQAGVGTLAAASLAFSPGD